MSKADEISRDEKAVKKKFGRLLCRIGLHDWKSDCDNVDGTLEGKTVVLIWWQCERCAETKLKFISH